MREEKTENRGYDRDGRNTRCVERRKEEERGGERWATRGRNIKFAQNSSNFSAWYYGPAIRMM